MIQSRTQSSTFDPKNYRDLLRNATMQLRSLRAELETVRQQQHEPIAIIGMACRFPGGANTPEAYWELLRSGTDAITEIPNQRWNVAAHYDADADAPGKMYTRCGGFIDDVDQFDPQFFGISPREARSLDPQQRLLLEISYTALENAGQAPFDLRGTRTGVFVGISFDDYAQLSVRSGDLTRIDAHSSLGNTRSMAAGRLAYTFGFQGPTMQLDTTCSSSLLAVHLACQSLRSGESSLALAGGVNLMLSPEPSIGFCKLKALALDGRCKTFDATADGYGRGEGCGVVVLKRLSDAIDNQDPILALVRGSAVNHDGPSNGLTAPNGVAQEAVLRQALDSAQVAPDQVQYVEVHGTGTRLGDPIEVLALNKVMGERPEPLLIGSVKTNIGHLESAAGVAGLIKVILSLEHQQIPPHLHLQTPNPYIPWDQLTVSVPTQLTPWPATAENRRAGISAFGMSGTNVHLVLESAPEKSAGIGSEAWADFGPGEQHQRPLHLLTLSARNDVALRQLLQRYADWLDDATIDVALPDICFSASVGRSHFNHRLALIAADLPQLRRQLESHLDGTPSPAAGARQTSPSQKIAFLFTGQGSQYPDMGRDLYHTEPVFQQAIDQCAEILATQGVALLDLLYGKPGDSKQGIGNTVTREQPPLSSPHLPISSSPSIHSTEYAQPALFALEYALAQLWRSWGIEPDGVMGHSLGEYVAACIAGVFSLADGLRLVAARSRLMQALPSGGGMVAVMATAEALAEHLPAEITIAAINGPEATVISGALTALETVTATLTEHGIKTTPLPVSHAFHSPLMEPMLAPFRAVANTVSYARPQIEFISNLTGHVASTEMASAHYWVNQVRQPVQFATGIQTLAAANYDTFLEIGPKPVLSAMGQACLPEPAARWLPSLRPDADWKTLLSSLGQLYAAGATIDWAGFDHAYPRRMVKLPNYPFQHQRYWVEPLPTPTPSFSPTPHLHPLLGSPLPLAGETRYFQAQLNPGAPAFLADHQVFGAIVMPAAGYLEGAIAAAHSLPSQSLTLCDVFFMKALMLPESTPIIIQTMVTPLVTGDSEFEIFSRAESSATSPWQCHAKGRIVPGISAPAPFALTAKQQALSDTITPQRFYETYHQRGISYGPSFRRLSQIWLGTGEALAQIHWPDEQRVNLAPYHLHPILLDAGFQLAGATLAQQAAATTYLPVSVERFSLYSTESLALKWVYAKRQTLTETDVESSQPIIDIHFLAENGDIIATVVGLRLQRISSALLSEEPQASAEPETIWSYQVAWLPQPLPIQPVDVLLPPATIRDRTAVDFGQLLFQPEVTNYQTFLPQLEALSLSYMTQALQDLGWSPRLGETLANQDRAEPLEIAPQHQRFFKHILETVEKRTNNKHVLPTSNDHPTSFASSLPLNSLSAELTLLNRCGENLAAVLRGEIDPLTLLFPEGDLSDLIQLYESSPGAQVMNTLVQKAISVAVSDAQRPIRILEIGAGTGGTTAHLLPHLPNVEYVFTDVSPLFLNKAQGRFQDYPYVRYNLLDIERSPVDQGFQQPFDLVIAANVLHATADLRQTLAHVRELLAPGGELILLEGTHPLVWFDLIFGLTEGWWKFTDLDLRPRHPLLSVEQWQNLLAESGFTTAVLQPKHQESATAGLPQAVMVAQRDDLLAPSSTAPDDWLILSESAAMVQPLANHLRQQGQSSHLATPDLSSDLVLDWSASNLEARLLQILQARPQWKGVVYLPETPVDSDSLPEVAQTVCRRALYLVQAVLKADLALAPRLYLVTQETTALTITKAGLARSPLWGLAKTVALEHPELRCTCLNLDGAAVQLLTAELLADSPEQYVSLQRQQRLVARLQPYTPAETATGSVQLIISEPGILANLTFQPVDRSSPTADEVEIRIAATGLNFRDVLMALGQYPGEPVLGCECTGVVVAVGDAVTDLAIGQRVMGIASGSFSQSVTVNRAMVIPIPEDISLEAAATIPVAFLTAYYSLVQLAQIKPGDRVLIHAAAGGVGQAAIQIAQSIGADIIATASPSKWETVRSHGITHVFNSRTLTFADEIMTLTQGTGVDVVLNSLAGEFRDRSIQVLRPDGRFIELGLGDLSVPTGKPYFLVNLVALCQKQPDLIQSMLQTLHQQFESGVLRPLPYTTFPLSEATQAFRTMQQAKHVGKIVLKVDEQKIEGKRQQSEEIGHREPEIGNREPSLGQNSKFKIQNSSTYLITGGMGGLGLQVAGWMIAQGARHLLLMGRSEPTAEAREQIQAWETQGITVEIAQVDVCDVQALTAVLTRIAESAYPLRGVIHGAGVLSDGLLEQLTWEQFERVLAPKVEGAWHLHRLTQALPLDFFVLFSSAASLLGTPGQANHAAANAFLDGLAHYRRSQGLPGLSLNWGAWSDIGAALTYQQGNALTGLQGVELISPKQGLQQLASVWSQPVSQIGIVPIQWSVFLRQGNLHQSPFLEVFRPATGHRVSGTTDAVTSETEQAAFRQELAATPPDRQRAVLEVHVCAQISQILGFAPEELERQTGFFDLGLDSLTAMELKNGLQASLGCSLPTTLAFDYPTVERLLDYLAEQLISEPPLSELSSSANESELDVPNPAESTSSADLAAQLDQKLADLEDLIN